MTENWFLSKDIIEEFLETTKLSDHVTKEELAKIIDDNTENESLTDIFFEKRGAPFKLVCDDLASLLIDDKKVSLQELLNHD